MVALLPIQSVLYVKASIVNEDEMEYVYCGEIADEQAYDRLIMLINGHRVL